MALVPCCGVIVFNDQGETILVETERGHLSFPKGKRNKKEDDLNCALRECTEETGLHPSDIELLEDIVIDEHSEKGNKNVRYFIAKLIKKDKHQFKFDEEELKSVAWYRAEDVPKLDGLKDKRKEVFAQAYQHYINSC